MNFSCKNSEREGTGYFEFMPGQFADKFWGDDSTYLSIEIFDLAQMERLFKNNIPGFDYYGITQMSRDNWEQLMINAAEHEAKPVLDELAPWVREAFQKHDVITILGI